MSTTEEANIVAGLIKRIEALEKAAAKPNPSFSGAVTATNDADAGSGVYVQPFPGATVEGGQVKLEGAAALSDVVLDNYNNSFRVIVGSGVPFYATDAAVVVNIAGQNQINALSTGLQSFGKNVVVGPSTSRRMIQQGVSAFTTDANGLSGVITFPTAFPAAPAVTFVVISTSTTFIAGKLHSVTATGFEARMFGGSPPTPSNGGNLVIHWIAMGTAP